MYCPQCGTESQTTLQYCRVCGANLKVIGKAVSLSEAIARSDRGPLPRIKEMVKGLKVDHVTEEVSRALERMNNEIALISPESKPRESRRPWINLRKKKTPEERREDHITKGVVSLFSGIGITVFLYFLSASLVLKLPPGIIEEVPFEIEPVVRIIWLLGLLPAVSGFGHIIAGLLIRPQPHRTLGPIDFPRRDIGAGSPTTAVQNSITEHTTELLERGPLRKPIL